MKSNPYHSMKVRPLVLSDYMKKEISKALHDIEGFDNVNPMPHAFGPMTDDVWLVCAMQAYAEKHRRWLMDGFERGELVGIS